MAIVLKHLILKSNLTTTKATGCCSDCLSVILPCDTINGMGTKVSPEDSTEQLINDTLAALPPYPETWAMGGSFATYNLSVDETSFLFQKFKYKFQLVAKHDTTPNDFWQRVFWNETLMPLLPDGGQDPNPANWICTPRSCTFEGSLTQDELVSSEFEIVPTSNCLITITDIRWSGIKSYQPRAGVPPGQNSGTDPNCSPNS